MAKLSSALSAVKSQPTRFVPERMILDAAAEAGHKWRACKQDPAMVVCLMLTQLLAGVSLLRLDRVALLGVSAAAVCKVRKKLPLSVWMKLAEWTGRSCRGCRKVSKYCEHRVCLIDGPTLTAPDTPELAASYGKVSNHKETQPGYPVPKLRALMDWATGTIAAGRRRSSGDRHPAGRRDILHSRPQWFRRFRSRETRRQFGKRSKLKALELSAARGRYSERFL